MVYVCERDGVCWGRSVWGECVGEGCVYVVCETETERERECVCVCD